MSVYSDLERVPVGASVFHDPAFALPTWTPPPGLFTFFALPGETIPDMSGLPILGGSQVTAKNSIAWSGDAVTSSVTVAGLLGRSGPGVVGFQHQGEARRGAYLTFVPPQDPNDDSQWVYAFNVQPDGAGIYCSFGIHPDDDSLGYWAYVVVLANGEVAGGQGQPVANPRGQRLHLYVEYAQNTWNDWQVTLGSHAYDNTTGEPIGSASGAVPLSYWPSGGASAFWQYVPGRSAPGGLFAVADDPRRGGWSVGRITVHGGA